MNKIIAVGIALVGISVTHAIHCKKQQKLAAEQRRHEIYVKFREAHAYAAVLQLMGVEDETLDEALINATILRMEYQEFC